MSNAQQILGLPFASIEDADLPVESAAGIPPSYAVPTNTLFRLIRTTRTRRILCLGSPEAALAALTAQREFSEEGSVTLLISKPESSQLELLRALAESGATIALGALTTSLARITGQYDFIIIGDSAINEQAFLTVSSSMVAGGYLVALGYNRAGDLQRWCNEMIFSKQIPFAVNNPGDGGSLGKRDWIIVRNSPVHSSSQTTTQPTLPESSGLGPSDAKPSDPNILMPVPAPRLRGNPVYSERGLLAVRQNPFSVKSFMN